MSEKYLQIRNSTADFLIFTKQAGEDGIEVRVSGESVWLTQKGMARLFDCSTDNIGLHLKNIYASGELEEAATTEESSVVQSEGTRKITRKVKFIIWMQSFLSGIGSTPCVQRNFVNGQRMCCGHLRYKAMCLIRAG